ncbi:pyridoxamine 5'-phosphate oxidase family protein [Desulfolutivibrio sp.]|uniref:pyridoxamine 5'-phosphate oxidase family protein n=1 Tax=Desulfolutivibrio sp. TaxID=2773296 RepID=UPI002F96B58E
MPHAAAHPHGPMRRKDREITDRAAIDDILRSGRVMHLGLCDDNVPFVVPVFYAYDGQCLYFHSARAGTKIAIMKKNPVACFEILDFQGVIDDDAPCDFEARHRTAIGLGKAVFVTDEAEKITALNMIVARFSARSFEFPKTKLGGTAVVKIEIESVKGKTHGLS